MTQKWESEGKIVRRPETEGFYCQSLLKDAPILLLDEPTSAVDVETEQEIQVALREISHNRTVITIAHRRNTIADADEIYVFENGEIVRREVRTNGI